MTTPGASLFAMALLLVPADSEAPHQPAEPLREHIARLEEGHVADLVALAREPREAAGRLIDELHVIDPPPAAVVSAGMSRDGANLDALRVIWRIRALRYVTGGLDFRAPSTYAFKEEEKTRRQFLQLKSKAGGLPFFSTWMSRDISYLAPVDAQEAIINQWREWFRASGDEYRYEPFQSTDSILDWYF